jgi:hypothetical protein
MSELKMYIPKKGDATALYEKNGYSIQLIIDIQFLMENIVTENWIKEKFEQFKLFEFIDSMDDVKPQEEIIDFLLKLTPFRLFFQRGELSIYVDSETKRVTFIEL